jgi:hypothetical protein
MRIGVRRAPLSSVVAVVLICVGGGTPAAAQGCPNEQIRDEEIYALRLPDCRAYEQVSPVDKNAADALGGPGLVQSSPSGEAVAFFSVAPFPGIPGAAELPSYVSARGLAGPGSAAYATQGLLPQSGPGAFAAVVGLTEDLSDTILYSSNPPLVPEATAGEVYYYLHDNVTGSYRLLAPGVGTLHFADATPDASHVLFEYRGEQLLPEAKGRVNLYEWDDGQLSLADVLPNGEYPLEGAVSGPGGPAAEEQPGGATSRYYTQNTISEDGSRVFFTDIETGKIYAREPEANPARTIPVSVGEAVWRAATPDGRYVFYTESGELYRFDLESRSREPIAPAIGVVGASDDGSYAYFVDGSGELHEWHDGAITPIARLSTAGDASDWHGYANNGEPDGPAAGQESSRVTPSGTTVMFTSVERLTGYDNAGNFEIYLYDATSGRLTCVSCNPNGVPAASGAYLTGGASVIGPGARNSFLTRNLSEDGSRVFFQTAEALVQQDKNLQMDVYEWEGGQVHLISTGRSASQSYFGDASANGDDVFFFTRQSLVGQDQDDNADLYDARVEGGIASQNGPPPAAPCTGEACRGAPSLSPALEAPSSATSPAAGNLVQQPEVKPKAKPLTRAQKLSRALKTCRKQRARRRRAVCEARARRRYGGGPKAKKSNRRGK